MYVYKETYAIKFFNYKLNIARHCLFSLCVVEKAKAGALLTNMSTTLTSSSSTSSTVTLHSKLTAVSSKPFGSGKTHTLCGLDHAMGSHTLHMIFYYKDEDNLFRSFGLDSLRKSLSEVLTMYPTVTGRLARGQNGNWEVRCNDAGVRVIEASVDTTLHQWLTYASASQEARLIHWEHMPDDDPCTWSPFIIQISSFQEGGVAVGLSCSHMLADITCAASFFKSWAEAHRHVPITNRPSFTPLVPVPIPIPRDAKSPPTRYANMSSTKAQMASSKNMAKASFKFSSSIIKQCLSKVHDKCPNATPFDFLSALFWTRIVAHLRQPKNHDQTHSISICTDFRRFLKAQLPLGYFGNALHFSTVSLNAKDMDSDELGGTVNEVHRHLEGLEEKEIWSSIEWFESQKESEGGKFRSPSCMYGPELTCFCMEHMIVEHNGKVEESSLLYEAVFSNDEKPAHVSCHVGNVVGEGLIMVMPSSEGGLARTVMVMLPEEKLAELSEDQAILQLQPTTFFTDTVANGAK